jgi:hypothetical protein
MMNLNQFISFIILLLSTIQNDESESMYFMYNFVISYKFDKMCMYH